MEDQVEEVDQGPKLGRPEGSTNRTSTEINEDEKQRLTRLRAKYQEKVEASDSTYTGITTHIFVKKNDYYWVENFNGFFEKPCLYIPLNPIYGEGCVFFINSLANVDSSREYTTHMHPEVFGIKGGCNYDDIPEKLFEIMKHNCEVYEKEFNWNKPVVAHSKKEKRVFIMPETKPEAPKGLIAEYNPNEKEWEYRKDGRTGRQVTPERRKLLNEQKKQKAANPDKIVEIIDDEVIVRDRKRRGNPNFKGRKANPERQKLIKEHDKLKKKNPNKVVVIEDGEVVIRDAKPRGRKVDPKRKKLIEKLKAAQAKCKDGYMAEIVDNKIVTRKKKKRGRAKVK